MLDRRPPFVSWLLGLLAALTFFAAEAFAETKVYLQVSSHPSRDTAVAAAQRYVGEHEGVAVHASSSGYYAVTIAKLPQAQAESLLERLLSASRVPSDAYLTEGRRFGRMVWSSFGVTSAAPASTRTAAATKSDIILSGPINAYAALGVARQISASPNAQRIQLDSEGGNVFAGLTIARMVFNAGFDTYIPPGAGCYSACFLIFAAGRAKRAEGLLGVHQMSGDVESNEATQFHIAEILQDMEDYSVPPEVIRAMLRTPAEDMYVFTSDELNRFGWR